MQITDVKINNIEIVENVRSSQKEKDLGELMESIKQHGLKHPIGISKNDKPDHFMLVYGSRRLEACRKLGWKTVPCIVSEKLSPQDFLIINMTENIQRKDISMDEMGRLVLKLKKEFEMSNKEVASRLGIHINRIRTSIEEYQRLPAKYRNQVEYVKNDSRKPGIIPATTAKLAIALKKRYTLNDAQLSQILALVKSNGISVSRMGMIMGLMKSGFSIERALKEHTQYQCYHLYVTVNKAEIEKIANKAKTTPGLYLTSIVYGEQKPVEKPIFITKTN